MPQRASAKAEFHRVGRLHSFFESYYYTMNIIKILVFFTFIFLFELAWFQHQYHVRTAAVQPNPYVRVATRGFKRAMEYHGTKSAYWDWDKGTWCFKRNGQVVELKTGIKRNGLIPVLKTRVKKARW